MGRDDEYAGRGHKEEDFVVVVALNPEPRLDGLEESGGARVLTLLRLAAGADAGAGFMEQMLHVTGRPQRGHVSAQLRTQLFRCSNVKCQTLEGFGAIIPLSVFSAVIISAEEQSAA